MPPKDDDEAPTTKDVVSKKHKQMLNREELDLSLIAEAFGGVIFEDVETEVKGQQSFPGFGKRGGRPRKKGEPRTVSPDDARRAFERSMEPPDRRDKYRTNKPVSAKQVQQFDKDIAGQAADQRSGAGGKPGAGRTGSLRGQTITGGPFKGATPIDRSEADILRKYAKSPGVGQNPLRAEPGSGAELTPGRRRSLKASARRAQEKKDQAARTREYKSQVTKLGKEVLKDVQAQGKREARLRAAHQRGVERGTAARMKAAATRQINRQGSEVLRQVQGKSPGQLSFPGLGRSLSATTKSGATVNVINPTPTPPKPKGAASNPWNQFPKKSQKQYGIPKPESSRLPTRLLTPSKPPVAALPPAKPRPTSTYLPPADVLPKPPVAPSPTKPPAAAPPAEVIKVPVDSLKPRAPKPNPVIKALKQFKRGFTSRLGKAASIFSLTQTIPNIVQNLDTFSPDYVPPKPVEPKVKPVQPEPKPKPKREPTPEPQIFPFEPTKKKPPAVKAPPVTPPSKDNKGTPSGTDTPDKTKAPVQVPVPGPIVPRTRSGTGTTVKPPKPIRKPGGKLPRFGFPEQPGGKIGRRSNPQ